MVTLDLADKLTFADGDGLEIVGAGRPRRAGRRRQPRAPGAARRRPDGATCARQAHPGRRRSRRRLGRRRRRAALGRRRRPRAWRRARRRRAVLPRRRPGPGHRHRRGGRAAAVRSTRTFTLADRRRSAASTAAPSTGRGTSSAARRADGPNDLEPAALAVEPRLAEWRDRLGEATGQTPDAGGQRLDVVRRGRRSPATAGSSPARLRGPELAELLAGAALPAGALQHLLVLLLAHALAALLDQRTHEGETLPGALGGPPNRTADAARSRRCGRG